MNESRNDKHKNHPEYLSFSSKACELNSNASVLGWGFSTIFGAPKTKGLPLHLHTVFPFKTSMVGS